MGNKPPMDNLVWRVVVLAGMLWGARPAHAQVDASVTDDAGGGVDAAPADSGVPCGDVDSLGQCQGNVLRVCADGVLNVTDCLTVYGPAFTCQLLPPVLTAQCVFVPDDAGPPVADEDAGPLSINPVKEPDASSSGCGCTRPAWGQSSALMLGLFWMRPQRRRGGARPSTRP